jgi:regulator of PEP synthase PpsR (kinase-PPPase family)
VSPDRLVQLRRNRLRALHEDRDTSYVDSDSVRAETIAARRIFERRGWPVIDVTRRSVEETAAAVINIISGGRGQVEMLG